MDKDDFSCVQGVKVEVTKDKRMNWVAGVKVEVRKTKRNFFKITSKLGLKKTTATIPRQRRQKYLLVFFNSYREVRKRTEIPL